jgi:restriction system protein
MVKRAWMVKAERDGRPYDAFKENSLMAICWRETCPLTDLNSREKIAALVAKTRPEWKSQAVARAAGQLQRFRVADSCSSGIFK